MPSEKARSLARPEFRVSHGKNGPLSTGPLAIFVAILELHNRHKDDRSAGNLLESAPLIINALTLEWTVADNARPLVMIQFRHEGCGMIRPPNISDSSSGLTIRMDGNHPLELTVVVPVHDESGNIERLIEEICGVLRTDCRFEIVVVDDGSKDDSLKRLTALQPAVPELRVLAHSRSCGQSTALWTGIRNARAPFIATLDGDGQNDPQDIPKLAKCVMRRTDERHCLAAGHRRGRQDTRWRRFCSRLANVVRSRMLHDETPDSGCGIKCFPRNLFLEFPYFNHMHRFLPALAKRHGAIVVSVEVRHRPRTVGRSHYGTWDRLRVGVVDLFGVMWLLRRTRLPDQLEYFENDLKRNVAGDRTGRPTVVHGQIPRAVA